MKIEPPDGRRLPKWAKDLLRAANMRNRIRGSQQAVYRIDDLIAAWEACGGCCAFSGMPFSFEVVGDGQAKRPFAPSLDRIDRHKSYQRDNVRLVAAVANFAMNAWGDEPVLRMANALRNSRGDHLSLARDTPSDAKLDEIATTDMEFMETSAGIVAFPPRPDLRNPVLEILKDGPQSSRDLEDRLAEWFGITNNMRNIRLGNNIPVWHNQVSWVLVDLGKNNLGTAQIERIQKIRLPDGGSMGVYRLASE